MRAQVWLMTMLLLVIAACTPIPPRTPTATAPVPGATIPVAVMTTSPSRAITPPPTLGYESPMMAISAENASRLVGVEMPLPALAQDLLWGNFNQLLALCRPDAENNAALAAYLLFPPSPTTSAEYPAILNLPSNLLAIPRHPIELALNNGDSVITTSLDGTPIHRFEVDGPVYGAAYTPNQQFLVVYLADRWEVQVWDLATGERLATLNGFETAAPVYTVIPGPDVIAWVARATLQLQNWRTGELAPAVHYTDFITAVALAPQPDGPAAVLAAGQLHFIQTDTFTETLVVDLPGATALAFSPDGRIVAAGGNQGVTLWDVNAGSLLASLPGDVTRLGFSDDGTTLAAIQNDRLALLLWQPH